ncbi:MAG: hypothetical protein PWQ82_203 [Thermosediminibacterales bacterium]|nr:hypothetical protein [Thermosediminibacterales bacterium]MDK2835225.1 hypothetical protein [Thermosediminibacterales bacterium]
MTIQSDLQKTVATAQLLLGTYATFAESTQDETVKKMFQEMSQDMQRHINSLNLRLSYLEKNNPMYQQQQPKKQQQ